MKKVSFTVDFVKKLSNSKEESFLIHDEKTKYLAVRRQKKGRCFYYYVRKISGKANFVKIGELTAIALDEARKIASAWSLRIAAGLPLFEDNQTKTPDLTIGDCVELYLASRLARRGESRSFSISKRRFEMYLPKSLRNRPVDQVKRADIEGLMFDVADRSGKRNASLLIIDLRAAINYMMKNEHPISRNPAAGVKLFDAVERSRFLLESEMTLFFTRLAESDSEDFRDMIRLLIFTGKRKSNICGIRWRWINWEMGCIVIPAGENKNREEDVTVLGCVVNRCMLYYANVKKGG